MVTFHLLRPHRFLRTPGVKLDTYLTPANSEKFLELKDCLKFIGFSSDVSLVCSAVGRDLKRREIWDGAIVVSIRGQRQNRRLGSPTNVSLCRRTFGSCWCCSLLCCTSATSRSNRKQEAETTTLRGSSTRTSSRKVRFHIQGGGTVCKSRIVSCCVS